MRRIAEGTKTNSEDTTNSSARKDNAYTRLLLGKKPGNRKEILIETGVPNARNTNKECFSAGTQHLLIINEIQEQDSGKYKLKFGSEHEYYTEIKIEKSADYDLKSPKSEISEKKFKTENIIMDLDPNWTKVLNPDPNLIYLDPQH